MAGESFGEQKAVGGNAQRGVMVKAAPAAPFVVVEPEFLLEFLVVALDAPALMGDRDQLVEGAGLRQRREVVLLRLRLMSGPFDQQPL